MRRAILRNRFARRPVRCPGRELVAILGLMAASLSVAPPAKGQDAAVLSDLYGSGVHAYFAHDYSKARELLSSAIDQGSRDPRCYYFRSMVNLRMGYEDMARRDMETGAELESRDVNSFYPVAQSLQRVQGRGRLMLQKARQQARLDSYQRQKQRERVRYEAQQDRQGEVTRRQAIPVPETITTPSDSEPETKAPGDLFDEPDPATKAPPADDGDVIGAPDGPAEAAPGGDPFAEPPATTPADPPGGDPFSEPPADPPAKPPGGDPFSEPPPTPPADPPGGDPFSEPPAADPPPQPPAEVGGGDKPPAAAGQKVKAGVLGRVLGRTLGKAVAGEGEAPGLEPPKAVGGPPPAEGSPPVELPGVEPPEGGDPFGDEPDPAGGGPAPETAPAPETPPTPEKMVPKGEETPPGDDNPFGDDDPFGA